MGLYELPSPMTENCSFFRSVLQDYSSIFVFVWFQIRTSRCGTSQCEHSMASCNARKVVMVPKSWQNETSGSWKGCSLTRAMCMRTRIIKVWVSRPRSRHVGHKQASLQLDWAPPPWHHVIVLEAWCWPKRIPLSTSWTQTTMATITVLAGGPFDEIPSSHLTLLSCPVGPKVKDRALPGFWHIQL